MNRGFSVVELVISLGIFAVMTVMVVVKFGNFNESTLLTDTAYDMAVALRTAQTYGLSVKSAGAATSDFNQPYGIFLSTSSSGIACGSGSVNNRTMALFADISPSGSPDGSCASTDQNITVYSITRGTAVSALCVVPTGSNTCSTVSRLYVSYRRPNPEARICASTGGAVTCGYPQARATIRGSSGAERVIMVRENGQITIQQ